MKILSITLIFALSLSCPVHSQTDSLIIPNNIRQAVAEIEKTNVFCGSTVWEDDQSPDIYANFMYLVKNAPKAELIRLTDHPNGVVRCYAFWALTLDSTAAVLPIVLKHIMDDAPVKTQFGCIKSVSHAGDLIINIVTPGLGEPESKKLTQAEINILDSVLIYSTNNLRSKNDAIARTGLSENLYTRIRELAVKDKNGEALVTLAKFKREQDIPLIIDFMTSDPVGNKIAYSFHAVSMFPHPVFLPMLEEQLFKNSNEKKWDTEWKDLYNAVACYKNDAALYLLKKALTQSYSEGKRKYHINFIFSAVQKNYTTLYESLLWDLWENENKVSAFSFNLLYHQDRQRAYRLAKKTLMDTEGYYYTGNWEDYDHEVNTRTLIYQLADTVSAHEGTLVKELIRKNLLVSGVDQFTLFAGLAEKYKDDLFIGPLFARVESEDNPHIFLRATEILLSYNDKSIRERLAIASKKNPNLAKDWGGNEFEKLLKNNGIN